MAPSSQGSVAIRQNESKDIFRAGASVASIDPRPAKRPRLSPTKDKENASILRHGSTSVRSPAKRSKPSFTADDEANMMENLMAGLDASIFDNFTSSPVTKVPSQSRVNARTPGKGRSDRTIPSVKREILSPTKNTYHTRPIAMRLQPPFKQSPDLKPVVSSPKGKRKASPAMDRVTIKHEMTTMARVKDEAFDVKEDKDKPELDDELFEFEFDLADLSAADLDLLDGTSAPVVKYPILNPPVPSPPADYRTTPWMRCCVVVALAGLQLTDGVVPPEEELLKFDMLPAPRHGMGKTVVVKQEGNDFRRVIHLKERWEDLPLRTGDIINIISPSLEDEGSKQPILISFKDPKSFIIHHPDIMLTMTSIANAMPCPRKPILQSLIRMPGPASKPMLYGNILHGLLQGALQEQNFGIDETRRRLNDELRKESIKLDVWGTGLGLDDVRQEVGGKAGLGFEKFGQKWIGSTPKNEGDLHAQSGEKPSLLAITGLHDVEEDIWSPKWGLKGKVDASVQASILAPGAKQADENIAPLEIKTGRSVGVMAHRAQTMLYTLLMEDRYGIPVPAGLLYYSQLDSVLRVEAKSNEIRALIITRNELASYLANERTLLDSTSSDAPSTEKAAFLPPTTDHAKECKSCYAVDSCMLYRRAIDNVPTHDDDDEIFELYAEKAGELTDADAAFFKKWENLLTIEEQDVLRFKSQLWTMTAEQREKAGRCFSNMVISAYSNDLGKSLAKIHRHSYTFTRAQLDASQSAKSLLSGHIARGDPVNLSIEPDILCLSRGFVTDLKPDSITIGVAYVIDPAALLERTKHRNHAMSGDKVVFRIDKDEMAAGTMKMRANLAALFFSDVSDSVKRLRQLVVQHQAPEYEIARLPRSEEIPDSFNADQTKAMEKIMTAKDYSLILGMPGTGKTTAIAEIIKALVARGKTVLLSSYTHSAVDTILMKLLNSEFEMLRLGNIDKVHPDVQHLTLEAHEESSDLLQLDARLMRPPVVAATCLSVDHPLFFKRRFDYCIVDEASQITLPTCLGPLRLADTFVLVGDHFQLPPIVKNREAKQGGLDVSLFRLLSEAHPEAVVDLSHQYRMNEDIMLLSNRLIYENRLKCGNEFVAKQSLVLPRRKKCQEISGKTCSQPCWVQDLMAENVKAVFVDTDLVPAYDSRIGNLVQNEIEAGFIAQLSKALIASGLNPSDLAVITPYRQQIKLLTGLFADMPSVEILTADKSQGRDKECILISLVRSNASGYIGELLKDWRRINVSFTRAKRKLVIFGSRRTMAGDPLLKDFLQLMEEQKWIYTLPKGAKGHEGGPSIEPEESKAEGSVKAEENGKENVTVKEEKGKGKAKLGESLIERKPFLRDILADIG